MRKFDSKLISTITVLEVCEISLEREERETVKTTASRMVHEFSSILAENTIAVFEAQLKHAAKSR